jgi:hypothetical protein
MKYIHFKKYFPLFFYFILVIYIFQFRYKLDKNGPYFTSDGAIKIFQTVQYKEAGLLSLECYYPGKEFDSNFKYFPISYPWAIISDVKDSPKCVLEYPPFFYWIGSILLYFTSLSLLLYLPIVFYSIAIFLFDRILLNLGVGSFFRVFFISLSFFSFPLLTVLDYTESALFLLLYLYGFLRLARSLGDGQKNRIQENFYIGCIFGLAFFLRLEIIIPFAFLILFYFLIYRDFKKTFLMGTGFLVIISLFLLYNFYVSGNVLGFRYVSSIENNENSQADILSRLKLLRAYLWGDEVMVGILRFNPFCYILILFPLFSIIRGKLIREGNLFMLAGLFSIVCIPLYVTFYGGVGYFGLRYLEAPFFLLLIGFSYYFAEYDFFKKDITKVMAVLFLGIIFYFNLISTREGLKVLRSASADLHSLHNEFNRSERFIIHTSLYSSIWMGSSFINKIHILAYNTEMLNNYLENIQKDEQFLILQSPQDIFISSDIPRSLYGKYQTTVEINPEKIQIIDVSELFGVTRILAKRK